MFRSSTPRSGAGRITSRYPTADDGELDNRTVSENSIAAAATSPFSDSGITIVDSPEAQSVRIERDVTSTPPRSFAASRYKSLEERYDGASSGARSATTVGPSTSALTRLPKRSGDPPSRHSLFNSESIEKNKHETIGSNKSESIRSNKSESIRSNKSESIRSNRSESIGSNRSESIGSSKHESIGNNKYESIGNNKYESNAQHSGHRPDKNKAERQVRSRFESDGGKDGYVGFANLPNQVYIKSVKKGFEFNLMVVGESGLGKSTLINSMFLTDLYSADYSGPSQRMKKTVQIDSTNVIMREGGVQLRLQVVDSPGFGDAVDNSNCWEPVIAFIESRCEEYLNAESRVNRAVKPDGRVHCCLYFISPNGHGLKPLDVEFMKRLHDKVNIIPLIAKADTLTLDECREFKKRILNEIAQHKIKIYEFPDCKDEDENRAQQKLKDRVPLAVVGSNVVVESHGSKVRGRVYPWGVVEVENLEHNDFIALRNMLIHTHMQDLKDVTNSVHYENFRYSKLASIAHPSTATFGMSGTFLRNPLAQIEEEKKEHVNKMKKMEAEMEQVFEMKVKEKKMKLKESELDLQQRADQMNKSLEQQVQELEEKRQQYLRERHIFEEQQRQIQLSLESKEHYKKEKKKSLF